MAWIRSQDQTALFWAEGLAAEENSLYIWSGPVKAIAIGDFGSTSEALEELDSIERWIEGGAPGVYKVRASTE